MKVQKIFFELCNAMHMDIDKFIKFCNSLKKNYMITDQMHEADYIIIYACPFGEHKIESAKKIYEIVRTANSNTKILVTGCFVKVYECLKQVKRIVVKYWEDIMLEFCNGKEQMEKISRNVVVISEGCKKKCSYCIYGNLFPTYKSKQFEDVYNEVERLSGKVPTVCITGAQETSDYGIEWGNGPQIHGALDILADSFPEITFHIGWFHIAGLSDEMLETLEKNKNIKLIMLHIQHTSNALLKAMNRPKFEFMDERLGKLKKLRPDIIISTEVIIGFPGETNEELDELIAYLKTGIFDDVAVATYEKVKNTCAAVLPGQICQEEKLKRLEKIKKAIPDITCYVCPEDSDSRVKEILDKLISLKNR